SRGGAAQRCGEAAQAEAGPHGVGGPKAGRAWGTLRKALRVGQAKLNSPEDPGNTPRRLHVQGRVNLLNVPGTCQSSAPQRLILVVERQGRQGDAEQEDTSPMKMQNLPGSSSSITYFTPRRKGAQEKKSLGDVSKPAVGRTFPSWGVPLLGRSKKYALIPWGAEESKHTGAGKKSMARWARESVAAMALSGEENDPNRDPFPKGQLTTDRPWPSSPWMHHGKPSSANLNIRGAQDSGNSEPVAMNKGEVMPRGPSPSGEPRRQQQPRGKQGCPQCLVLQREIDDLKEQLASMQYLADKLQIV
ncbi:hypothetical protein FD754_025181, partial [Muntiacus muntjak]